jgi:hypothetical protein
MLKTSEQKVTKKGNVPQTRKCFVPGMIMGRAVKECGAIGEIIIEFLSG